MKKQAILISKNDTTAVRFRDEAGNIHETPFDHTTDAIRAIALWQRPPGTGAARPSGAARNPGNPNPQTPPTQQEMEATIP